MLLKNRATYKSCLHSDLSSPIILNKVVESLLKIVFWKWRIYLKIKKNFLYIPPCHFVNVSTIQFHRKGWLCL
nr:MAG TPA: hypothetical protein [Caudoviricetes sp.]